MNHRPRVFFHVPHTFPSSSTQNPHHLSGVSRRRRQSSVPSRFFPPALDGAAPPSQYPWAILWGPTISDEEAGALSPAYNQEGNSKEQEEPVRGLDLRGAPATVRPSIYPPTEEGTDPQLYVTIVISLLIVIAASGIIIKFCCERRQRRRQRHNQRFPLPEEGILQPLTDLSPDTDISGLNALKLLDTKSGVDMRGAPCRMSKIPLVAM
ncbi:PILR alpha-associated neural protein [Rhinophrynus dorsalis]